MGAQIFPRRRTTRLELSNVRHIEQKRSARTKLTGAATIRRTRALMQTGHCRNRHEADTVSARLEVRQRHVQDLGRAVVAACAEHQQRKYGTVMHDERLGGQAIERSQADVERACELTESHGDVTRLEMPMETTPGKTGRADEDVHILG